MIQQTIMSAQANLAALFEPTESEVWNEKVFWQPIPVHMVPQEMDTVLFVGKNVQNLRFYSRNIRMSRVKWHESIMKMRNYLHTGQKCADLRSKLSMTPTDCSKHSSLKISIIKRKSMISIESSFISTITFYFSCS